MANMYSRAPLLTGGGVLPEKADKEGVDLVKSIPFISSMKGALEEGIKSDWAPGWASTGWDKGQEETEKSRENVLLGATDSVKPIVEGYRYATNPRYVIEKELAGRSPEEEARQKAAFRAQTEKSFPEIGSVAGRSEVQNAMTAAKVKAGTEVLGETAQTMKGMLDSGTSYEVVQQQLVNGIKDPFERRIAQGELDKITGGRPKPEQKTGPVENTAAADVEKIEKSQPGKTAETPTTGTPKTSEQIEGDFYTKLVENASNELHYKHSAKEYDHWYEDNSMRVALVRFGLGLMSGEDMATAFSYAAKDYDNLYQQNVRQGYFDEMIDDGYTKPSVMEWLRSGDSSVLVKNKPGEQWVDFKDDYGVGQKNTLTGRKDYIAQVGEDYGFDESGNLVARGKSGEGGGKGLFTYSGNMQYGVGAQMMSPSLSVWRDNNASKVMDGSYGMMGDKDQNWFNSLVVNAQNTFDPHSLVGRWGLTKEQQQNLVDEKRFIEAYGRILSGGAIKEEEWKNWGSVFFPRPEDAGHPERLMQKMFMQDYVSLAMENIRGQHTNAEIMEAMGTSDPEVAQRMLFTQAIQQASSYANQIDGFDPNSGVYHLENGSLYHPRVGEYKVIDGKIQRVSR